MAYPRPILIPNRAGLREHLEDLVSEQYLPYVAGIDNNNAVFTAVLREVDGEVVDEAYLKDPYGTDPSWPDKRCPECGGLHRRFGIDELMYPVVILVRANYSGDSDLPGVPEQPTEVIFDNEIIEGEG